MSKRIYISADYSEIDGDRDVVETLTKWGKDNLHAVDFVDTAQVASGSVAKNKDCRICELKAEFNDQINASSIVVVVVGNMTAQRHAGESCKRVEKQQYECFCTPYKQNSQGQRLCKVPCTVPAVENIGNINSYSYLKHEFEQAKKKEKQIVVLYNSTRSEHSWLPSYMDDCNFIEGPFWIKDPETGEKKGNYEFVKKALGF